jgi:hypothetical protein
MRHLVTGIGLRVSLKEILKNYPQETEKQLHQNRELLLILGIRKRLST